MDTLLKFLLLGKQPSVRTVRSFSSSRRSEESMRALLRELATPRVILAYSLLWVGSFTLTAVLARTLS